MRTSLKKRRRIDGQEQGAMLTFFFPSFRLIARGNPYIWEGNARPIGGAPYTVRIKYRHGRRPVVEVLDPVLVPRVPWLKIPHTFDTGSLCLHLINEWDDTMFIHETIVPWTSTWLYYYEIWHATTEWRGGGHDALNDDDDMPLVDREDAP